MAPYGSFMAPYVSLWLLMTPYGFSWSLMAPYGSLWLLMAHYGSLWPLMALYGSLWLLMAPYGPPYGPLWLIISLAPKTGSTEPVSCNAVLADFSIRAQNSAETIIFSGHHSLYARERRVARRAANQASHRCNLLRFRCEPVTEKGRL